MKHGINSLHSHDDLLFAVGHQADIIKRLRALVRAYRAHHDLPGPDQFHAVLEAEHALDPGDMEDEA